MLPPKGMDYSSNKKFMALAERSNCKDCVSIYYADNDWKMVNTFDVDTLDLTDLKWTMNDGAILVWDNPLESRILVYSAMTGQVIASHAPDANGGLGIRRLEAAPN